MIDSNPSESQSLPDHALAWKIPSMVDKFADKVATDFFRSETRFMPRAFGAKTVLDIGCASGRLIELLTLYLEPGFEFTGVDLVDKSIQQARATYPQHTFHNIDYIGSDLAGSFDLVNATGVIQHEPRYRELIEDMIADSRQWVLFDAKVASIDTDLVDRRQSYVTIDDTRLFFIILAYELLVGWLSSLDRVRSVSVYGYETRPNGRTTVPATMEPFASVGIFLQVGDSAAALPLDADVPEFLQVGL